MLLEWYPWAVKCHVWNYPTVQKSPPLPYSPRLIKIQELYTGRVPSQGGVTPIDSIVTAATAVGQRSTVKAAQTGAVNGQSGSKVQSKTRAALFMAMCKQVLQGQIADRSKVNGQKSAWSTVKTPKTAVKALTRGRSCDYSVYGSDPLASFGHWAMSIPVV